MTKFSFALLMLVLPPLHAFAQAPIRTCTVQVPDVSVMKFDLYANRMELTTRVLGAGTEWKSQNKVRILEESVRPGMEARAQKLAYDLLHNGSREALLGLNTTEQTIVIARMIPLTGLEGMGPGLRVDAIRSAVVFLIGDRTEKGQSAIVVAKDANGRELGSFLAGGVTYPCARRNF